MLAVYSHGDDHFPWEYTGNMSHSSYVIDKGSHQLLWEMVLSLLEKRRVETNWYQITERLSNPITFGWIWSNLQHLHLIWYIWFLSLHNFVLSSQRHLSDRFFSSIISVILTASIQSIHSIDLSLNTYIHTYIHPSNPTYIHTYPRTNVRARTHTYTNTHVHVDIHIRVHLYILVNWISTSMYFNVNIC